MGTQNIWGQPNMHADRHTDRLINTMNRPALRALPIENPIGLLKVQLRFNEL